jgi:hypothetical protein
MTMKTILFLLVLLILGNSVGEKKILHKVEKEHYFSSAESKDTFQILLTGDSIIDGEVVFRILSTAGDTIFTESFPSNYLIGYESIEEDTAEKKEEYILQRMSGFFDEKNFSQPAIGENESCDADYSDCKIWDVIRKDRTAIGFHYLVGEEKGCKIAYSKILKRVVTYFCCC